MLAHNHLTGQECPECAKSNRRKHNSLTLENFIQKAKKIHGDKYDYSKVEYVNNYTKVCVICPKHGEFWQLPSVHLIGCGCPTCGNERVLEHNKTFRKPQDEVIRKANETHNNFYDYSKVNYKGAFEKVCIICPKHGEFWQTPDAHIRGNGCPKCKSTILEKDIRKFLNTHNLDDFIENKHYKNLDNLQLDFYLPKYKIAIECQGIQHFKSHLYFGGEEGFKKQIERDERKRELCNKNGIKLLYYSNLGIEYPYKVFEDKEELFKEIKQIINE